MGRFEMRILKRKTLIEFLETHASAKGALQTWFKTVGKEQWASPNDVKKKFGSADILPDNRVVFDIKGNSYRLVVKIHYNTKTVYIRFVGTHAEYDKIDAETV
jgi:mRNA interferase HigB